MVRCTSDQNLPVEQSPALPSLRKEGLLKLKIENLIDLRQTPQYADFMQSIGWRVFKYKNSQLFAKKLPLFPLYVGKILRCSNTFTSQEIKSLKRKYHLITISYEPLKIEKIENSRVYFESNKFSMQLTPTKTLWIDLKKSKNELLSDLKAKTRYNLKLAVDNLDYEIINGDDVKSDKLNEILHLWAANKPYSKLFPAPKSEFYSLIKCFKKDFFIVRVFQKHDPTLTLAFCLILCSPNMAFYWHNGSSDLGKKLFAPTLCLWHALMESKKRGLSIFDFEGLYDERFPSKNISWKGFSRFKEGFSKI